uniref:TF-B3 domain-containing protein n=1 Tax=Triticum urartu TaxID=4572 RepID=A0A8R7QFI9_TRIUA
MLLARKSPRKLLLLCHLRNRVLWVFMLMVGNSEKSHTTLDTSDYGRIVLDSKKWKEFAASRGLAVNSAILIGFKESMTGGVDVLLGIKILG